MAKIYVSSTFLDLQEYRAQVEHVIRRMGHEDVAMEYYVASDERPVEKCLADVAACDIYVGIFAWRYGWVPTDNNPQAFSITEMEYRQAESLDKYCLIFLLSEEHPWPRKSVDKNTASIEKLRNEASGQHLADHFTSSDDLARKVVEAINKWEKSYERSTIQERFSGLQSIGVNITGGDIHANDIVGHDKVLGQVIYAADGSTIIIGDNQSDTPVLDIPAYFDAMRKRFGIIPLDDLAPTQFDEYLPLKLQTVFVEQKVRENLPPVDLPKEVWAKLEREGELTKDDLPEGVSLEDVRRAQASYFEKPVRNVLDVLTDPTINRVVILGDPGSGKSTLARFLLLSLLDPHGAFSSIIDVAGDADAAEGEEANLLKQRVMAGEHFENYFPLLIELHTYVALRDSGEYKTFLGFLEYLGKTEGWHLNAVGLRTYLRNNGSALVVFDGLDEIFDPLLRDHITQQIVAFADEFPKARIIVTSRIIGYRRKISSDAGFKHFTLQDLDEKQVAAFVNRWYGLALAERLDEAKERRERILRAFKESPSIRQLAGNPMLLTIMAIIGKHQELPRERWKLYDHAASVLIQHWDVNKHLQDKLIQANFIGEDDKKELLRRLAYRMQSSERGMGGNYIYRDELSEEFATYLKQQFELSRAEATRISRVIIDQFRERNFILCSFGANLYGFVHRAFLEFFCASEITYRFEKTRDLSLEDLYHVYSSHWNDHYWHEVLSLLCGILEERLASKIIQFLITVVNQSYHEQYRDQTPSHIGLAVKCMGELRNLNQVSELAERLLKLIFKLFEHWEESRDLLALEYHMNSSNETLYNERFSKFLEEQIIEPSRNIGLKWPNRLAIDSWLKENITNPYGIRQAKSCGLFIGIVGAGSDEIRQTLEEYLDHQNKAYRLLAIYALREGWRDEDVTWTKLGQVASQETDPQVRSVAIQAFTDFRINLPETGLLLKERLLNDNDASIRLIALDALVRHFFHQELTLSILHHSSISDIDKNVRRRAIQLLRSYFSNSALTASILQDRAENDPADDIRTEAKLALGVRMGRVSSGDGFS